MFKLHIIQAQFSGSLLLEFGASDDPRYVLVDGGSSGHRAAGLQMVLAETPGPGGKLDLLVANQIDHDHIVGVLDLLAEIEDDQVSGRSLRLNIANLWRNTFDRTLDPDGGATQELQSLMSLAGAMTVAMPRAAGVLFGVQQGNRLRLAAQKLGIYQNRNFRDDLVLAESAPGDLKFGSLDLRVAGPTRANLTALRKEWLDWLAESSRKIASTPAAAATADRSIPDLGSLVLLATCDGKTVLLTGDARGDHIRAGLATAGLAKGKKLHVDVLTVPQHGSSRNLDETFFRSVTADTYVISADGRYGQPDVETLQWIVSSAKGRRGSITLVVTNETESTRELRRSFDPVAYGYTLEVLEPGSPRHVITLSA